MRIVQTMSIFALAAGGIILAYAIFALVRFPPIPASSSANQYIQMYTIYESYDRRTGTLSVSAASPYNSNMIAMNIVTQGASVSPTDLWNEIKPGDQLVVNLKRDSTALSAVYISWLR